MDVDKKTTKIAIVSLVVALVWSYPEIQAVSGVQEAPTQVIISVFVKAVVVFCFIRFFVWLKKKK